MAITKSVGYTDTPIDGNPVLSLPRGNVNFAADFRVKSQTSGKEVVMTNLRANPLQPELIRIAYTDINNIYAGTGIESSMYAPTKGGVSILTQLTQVWEVTDSVSGLTYYLPLSVHQVIKTAKSPYIDEACILAATGRLQSSVFDTGSTSTARLGAILRGSLVPSEV